MRKSPVLQPLHCHGCTDLSFCPSDQKPPRLPRVRGSGKGDPSRLDSHPEKVPPSPSGRGQEVRSHRAENVRKVLLFQPLQGFCKIRNVMNVLQALLAVFSLVSLPGTSSPDTAKTDNPISILDWHEILDLLPRSSHTWDPKDARGWSDLFVKEGVWENYFEGIVNRSLRSNRERLAFAKELQGSFRKRGGRDATPPDKHPADKGRRRIHRGKNGFSRHLAICRRPGAQVDAQWGLPRPLRKNEAWLAIQAPRGPL